MGKSLPQCVEEFGIKTHLPGHGKARVELRVTVVSDIFIIFMINEKYFNCWTKGVHIQACHILDISGPRTVSDIGGRFKIKRPRIGPEPDSHVGS